MAPADNTPSSASISKPEVKQGTESHEQIRNEIVEKYLSDVTQIEDSRIRDQIILRDLLQLKYLAFFRSFPEHGDELDLMIAEYKKQLGYSESTPSQQPGANPNLDIESLANLTQGEQSDKDFFDTLSKYLMQIEDELGTNIDRNRSNSLKDAKRKILSKLVEIHKDKAKSSFESAADALLDVANRDRRLSEANIPQILDFLEKYPQSYGYTLRNLLRLRYTPQGRIGQSNLRDKLSLLSNPDTFDRQTKTRNDILKTIDDFDYSTLALLLPTLHIMADNNPIRSKNALKVLGKGLQIVNESDDISHNVYSFFQAMAEASYLIDNAGQNINHIPTSDINDDPYSYEDDETKLSRLVLGWTTMSPSERSIEANRIHVLENLTLEELNLFTEKGTRTMNLFLWMTRDGDAALIANPEVRKEAYSRILRILGGQSGPNNYKQMMGESSIIGLP